MRGSLGENGGKLVAKAGFDLRQHVSAHHCRAADDHRVTSADAADNFGQFCYRAGAADDASGPVAEIDEIQAGSLTSRPTIQRRAH
jgi:hypothetical protein